MKVRRVKKAQETMEDTKRVNLIHMKNEDLLRAGIPFKANTFYMWHSQGKHSEIFVKIGGKLFLNEKKFWEMALRGGEK